MATLVNQEAPSVAAPGTIEHSNFLYLGWTPIVAGAIVAAAVSSVLLTFGSAIGLAVVSPSATWRDTSSVLAPLCGVLLFLTLLPSFSLRGYLAGAFPPTRTP